jgi:predicted nucleic acid-binding protein
MKIVADTNVIVSALVFGGLPRRVFEVVEKREMPPLLLNRDRERNPKGLAGQVWMG